jgi:predicted GNAT superfamily acetyltransferase
MQRADALFRDVWRPANGVPPLDHDLMRALVDADSCYAAGAFDGDLLLGACVGFWARPADRNMHSHLAAVADGHRGRQVGFSLKLDQRAHALENSVDTITWTFDPLVARNAHLNIHKLGARPVSYRTNFYGPLIDQLNGADESDRFVVRWHLASNDVRRRCDLPSSTDAMADPATNPALSIESTHASHTVAYDGAEVVSVAIPPDIERLRQDEPGLAREWRVASRAAFSQLLGEGGRIIDFDRAAGHYLVRLAER